MTIWRHPTSFYRRQPTGAHRQSGSGVPGDLVECDPSADGTAASGSVADHFDGITSKSGFDLVISNVKGIVVRDSDEGLAMTAVRQHTGFVETAAFTPVIAAHFDKAAHSYLTAATLQQQVVQVKVSDALLDYLLALVTQSRQQQDCLPLSPRAAKALLRATKAFALLSGRHFATAEDVQQVFPSVAEHRLNPGSSRDNKSLSLQLLRQVPCPL